MSCFSKKISESMLSYHCVACHKISIFLLNKEREITYFRLTILHYR